MAFLKWVRFSFEYAKSVRWFAIESDVERIAGKTTVQKVLCENERKERKFDCFFSLFVRECSYVCVCVLGYEGTGWAAWIQNFTYKCMCVCVCIIFDLFVCSSHFSIAFSHISHPRINNGISKILNRVVDMFLNVPNSRKIQAIFAWKNAALENRLFQWLRSPSHMTNLNRALFFPLSRTFFLNLQSYYVCNADDRVWIVYMNEYVCVCLYLAWTYLLYKYSIRSETH